jgi:hypothetical protein
MDVNHKASKIRDMHFIDRNLLFGELNIPKGELCVKGNLAQDLGLV